jgi:hypothetical protein
MLLLSVDWLCSVQSLNLFKYVVNAIVTRIRIWNWFLGGSSYKNPWENQVGGTCFWSPTVSWA